MSGRRYGRSRGGLILLPGSQVNAVRVRNGHGEPMKCAWDDCQKLGDHRHRIEFDHPAPEFPGHKLIYIFCGDGHKTLYIAGGAGGRA